MTKRVMLSVGISFFISLDGVQAQSSASFKIRGSAFVNAGEKSTSMSFAIRSAMGQGGVLGKSSSASFALGGGFLRTLSAGWPDVTLLPGTPQAGRDAQVRADIVDPYGSPVTGTLYYRQTGQISFSPPVAMTGVGNTFTGTIPAASVTSRGLEIYISGSNGGDEGFFPFKEAPQAAPAPLRTAITNAPAPATLDSLYQLVSFPFETTPGDAGSQIDFSLTDRRVARLFWWDPYKADTTQDTSVRKGYIEFGQTGFPNFLPGRSMFLATRGSKGYNGTGLSTLPDTTINGEDYVRFPLDSGWNMIATPFAYNLNYDSVSVLASDGNVYPCPNDPGCTNLLGTSGVRNYISGTSYLPKHVMLPWRGYFAFNSDTGRIQVLFPKREMVISDPNLVPANEPEMDWPTDWKIAISAKSGDLVTPHTILGTAENASVDKDELDLAIPPALPGDFRVAFQRDKEFGAPGDYFSDIRPTLTESETWDFTVQPGVTRAIELSFDGLAEVPAEHDVILADVEGRAKQNLRTEPVYRFIASKDRHFELTVAPKTAGQVALLPTKYDLHQNLPNPFNPQTLIKYDLPEAANVRLEVFNLLGQKVATLVNRHEAAGSKSVVWDGTDERGAKVSSGLYFYKLAAGDYVATKKMMLVK